MIEDHHPDLIRVMTDPAFYPHPVERVERIETHISVVFLAGDTAYKVKKPVALGFLDFSTLHKRLADCRAEVRLNRRLTDGVYLGVAAITESEAGLSLEGEGRPVEYAVKMRRMPDRFTMGRLLAEDALGSGDIERLAARLVEFYRTVPAGSRIGGWETVRGNCEENFRQMDPFVGTIIAPFRFDLIRSATDGFLKRRRDLFEERLHNGSVREGHGDLRVEHVYFAPEGLQILDCIAFNERMRFNDVASDVAFLAMDLDYRGAYRTSEDLLCAFVPRLGDGRLLSLIDFYLCYRACVRLKVTCFRLRQERLGVDQRRQLLERTRTFAALACRYAGRFARPTVYVVMGLIAAGKSTLAEALSDAIDAPLLSSDRIRKTAGESRELKKNAADRSYGEGPYSRQARSRIYARMLLLAQERIRSHRSVVLDATFDREKERTEVRRLAEEEGVRIVFIECFCTEETIRSRLRRREGRDTASDARLPLLADFLRSYRPPEEIPAPIRLRADTERPLNRLVSELFVASRRIYGEAPFQP